MAKRSRAREVALQLLYQHELNPTVPREEIEELVQGRLSSAELQDLCLELFDGALEHQEEIDRILSELAENWTLSRMAVLDRNILRLGAMEMLYGKAPPRVALNEAIELARAYGSQRSSAFVNGILDKLFKQSSSS